MELASTALQHAEVHLKASQLDGVFGQVLMFLALGNGGLNDAALRRLTNLHEATNNTRWATLRYMLGPFVDDFGGRLNFRSDLFTLVINKRYPDPKPALLRLAQYYEALWRADASSVATQAIMRLEVPHDRFRALDMWKETGALLSDPNYTTAVYPDHALE